MLTLSPRKAEKPASPTVTRRKYRPAGLPVKLKYWPWMEISKKTVKNNDVSGSSRSGDPMLWEFRGERVNIARSTRENARWIVTRISCVSANTSIDSHWQHSDHSQWNVPNTLWITCIVYQWPLSSKQPRTEPPHSIKTNMRNRSAYNTDLLLAYTQKWQLLCRFRMNIARAKLKVCCKGVMVSNSDSQRKNFLVQPPNPWNRNSSPPYKIFLKIGN